MSTAALCEGCGYNGFAFPYPADDNLDNKLSLQEAYMYIKSWVEDLNSPYVNTDITQEVQVYPSDSDFTIVEYWRYLLFFQKRRIFKNKCRI